MSLMRMIMLIALVGGILYALNMAGIINISGNKSNELRVSAEMPKLDHYEQGKAMFMALKWDDALESYTKALRADPKHPEAGEAQFRIGKCYMEAKMEREALEAFRLYLRNYPEDDKVRMATAWKEADFLAAQLGVKPAN